MKRWKPENGEMYWYVWNDGNACWGNFTRTSDERRFKFGNCFKTEEEAKAAAEKVKALLLSLHDNGNNLATDLQDKPLPKLTAEVFDRPDCPEWAKYAAVDRDRIACFYDKKPKCDNIQMWLRGENGEHFMAIRSNKFDASDWQNSLIEHPAKLPDWCKEGEWVYYRGYRKVVEVGASSVTLESSLCDNLTVFPEEIGTAVKPARLRPYNDDEMKALVGKVICSCEEKAFLVIAYGDGKVSFGEVLHSGEDLTLEIYKFPDGSPCGVLEHLEEGEWVK